MQMTAGKTAAQQILLLCMTNGITPRSSERLLRLTNGPVDWHYVVEMAAFHGITPLVARNLADNGVSSRVPQPCLDELRKASRSTLYRNIILSAELAGVLSAFAGYGISAICLKGVALADSLYGNIGLRQTGDMDILLHPADIPAARALLQQRGYREGTPGKGPLHPFHGEPFWKQDGIDLMIELHWSPENRRLVDIPEEQIWRRARPLDFQGVSTLVLSPEDNFLFLSNHLFKHDTMRLKLLTDIAVLLEKHGETLDWDYIHLTARDWHIEPTVYYALMLVRELADTPIPDAVPRAMRPRAWRRWLVGYLADERDLTAPVENARLREWTASIVRSLLMKNPREMLYVLSRQEGTEKPLKWLRAIFWTAVVFIARLGRFRIWHAAGK